MKKNILFILFGLLFFYGSAEAHQPNFINKEKEVLVSNPEISQAFYGFLDNEPAVYTINSSSPFKLYVGLLTPDVAHPENSLFATITNEDGEELAKLDGINNFEWKHWYEEFAGDWYWQGPEFKKEVPAGKYIITIDNTHSKGEYVAVFGELESFPIVKMPGMLVELFNIKTKIFEKPWYSVFQNKIGKYLGIITILIFVLIIGILFLRKNIKNKK